MIYLYYLIITILSCIIASGISNSICVDNKILLSRIGTKSSYTGDAQSNDITRAGKEMDDLEKSL